MTETLIAIGGVRITVYALFCALALAAFVISGVYMSGFYRSISSYDILRCFLVCFPTALICARALYCAVNYDEQSFLGVFALWRGGFAMTGALTGACLAAWLYARARRINTGHMLDCITPGILIFVAIMRVAEIYTGQGLGKTISTGFMQSGIFAYIDSYGEARHNVRLYEALAALGALGAFAYRRFGALRKRRARKARIGGGEAFRVAALFWSMSQVVLESMRDDIYLHIDFFRIQQIVSMLIFVSVCAWYYVKLYKTRIYTVHLWLLLVASAACLAFTVNQEFVVDRDVNLEFNYLLMYLSMAGAAACALYARKLWWLSLK